jgi:hypothetical protein
MRDSVPEAEAGPADRPKVTAVGPNTLSAKGDISELEKRGHF